METMKAGELKETQHTHLHLLALLTTNTLRTAILLFATIIWPSFFLFSLFLLNQSVQSEKECQVLEVKFHYNTQHTLIRCFSVLTKSK